MLKLSVVIPAHDEEGSIVQTITSLYEKIRSENIAHEIVVVNDNSKDATLTILSNYHYLSKLWNIIPTMGQMVLGLPLDMD